MMTSQVVRKLEQKGLLARTVNEHDARSFLLQPTSAGVALANQAVRAVEQVDAAFFSALGNNAAAFGKSSLTNKSVIRLQPSTCKISLNISMPKCYA